MAANSQVTLGALRRLAGQTGADLANRFVWLWGPIVLGLLITGLAFLITLAVGRAVVRDTTTADVEAMKLVLDATYRQEAADAIAQRPATPPGN